MVRTYVIVDSVQEKIEGLTCLSHSQFLPFELVVFFFPRQSTYGWYRRLVYMDRLAVVVSKWHQLQDQRMTHLSQCESFHPRWNNITGALVRSFLICSNASSCLVPHFHGFLALVKSQNGLDMLEKPGINLAQNWADPRTLLTSGYHPFFRYL